MNYFLIVHILLLVLQKTRIVRCVRYFVNHTSFQVAKLQKKRL